MSRKSSFDLNRFYEGLHRVQSSLGKNDFRKTVNSPLVKQAAREDKSRHLDVFKRELKNKELAKTKINLDIQKDQPRAVRAEKREQIKLSNYRFSQLSGESKEIDTYDKVRQKLQGWRERATLHRQEISGSNSKVIQKSEVDDSQYFQFLQKTMETPKYQHFEQQNKPNSKVHQQLLSELTHRNEVYELVQGQCKQEKSYFRKSEDLAIRLQQHFRMHTTMKNLIQEFKRKAGLEISDLNELYDFLLKGREQKDLTSEQQLL